MLSAKHQLFCDTYLANGYKAREAYWDVFGHEDNLHPTQVYRLLKNPEIKAYIEERRKEIHESLCIDAMRVMDEIAKMAFEDATEGNKTSKIKALDLLSKNLNLQTIKTESKDVIEVTLIKDDD